jgi:hypothetical protein
MKLRYAAIPIAAVALAATGCASNNAPLPLTPAANVSRVPQSPAAPAPVKTVYVVPQQQQAPRVYVVPQAPVRTAAPVQPAPGGQAGPGIGNSYPINSEGSLINVRANPSTASVIVGTVSQDEYVTIDCTQYGDAVTGPWGTTSLWDHIEFPYNGYVSDEWVNTSSGAPVVGSC